MTIEQIKFHAERKPFRPFEIRLVNGDAVEIGESREFGVSPYPPHIITIFTRAGIVHLCEPESIIKIRANE
jgi:hypothetical protein